jgi:hypothetical protein
MNIVERCPKSSLTLRILCLLESRTRLWERALRPRTSDRSQEYPRLLNVEVIVPRPPICMS